jgi:hypothetical protein
MAKKSNTRNRNRSAKQPRGTAPSTRQRQRLVLGGVVLLVVIGIAVGIRMSRQQSLPPQLQGAIDGHYTRGSATAEVVIKEFSDYT